MPVPGVADSARDVEPARRREPRRDRDRERSVGGTPCSADVDANVDPPSRGEDSVAKLSTSPNPKIGAVVEEG